MNARASSSSPSALIARTRGVEHRSDTLTDRQRDGLRPCAGKLRRVAARCRTRRRSGEGQRASGARQAIAPRSRTAKPAARTPMLSTPRIGWSGAQ